MYPRILAAVLAALTLAGCAGAGGEPSGPAEPGDEVIVETSVGPMQAVVVSVDPPIARPFTDDCDLYRFEFALDLDIELEKAEPICGGDSR